MGRGGEHGSKEGTQTSPGGGEGWAGQPGVRPETEEENRKPKPQANQGARLQVQSWNILHNVGARPARNFILLSETPP